MLSQNFIYVGAILNLLGSSNYIWNTLKGNTKPNRVTWFIWALAPLVAFSAQMDKGVGLQSLMTFMVGFGPLLIFIASFVNKKSVWRLQKIDIICGSLSILGILLWFIIDDANIAIWFAIIADGLAAVPTLIKSYSNPETESFAVFFFAAISAGLTLLTIDNWTFAEVSFSVYIITICSLLSILIKFKLGLKLRSKYSWA